MASDASMPATARVTSNSTSVKPCDPVFGAASGLGSSFMAGLPAFRYAAGAGHAFCSGLVDAEASALGVVDRLVAGRDGGDGVARRSCRDGYGFRNGVIP